MKSRDEIERWRLENEQGNIRD